MTFASVSYMLTQGLHWPRPMTLTEGLRMRDDKQMFFAGGIVWVAIAYIAGALTAVVVAWLVSLLC